jgi:hypothetical protein
MPREAERLAAALWRTLKPMIVDVLDTALATQEDSEPDEALSPEDDTRIDKWLARRRQRDREQQQGQGKHRRTATPRSKAQ